MSSKEDGKSKNVKIQKKRQDTQSKLFLLQSMKKNEMLSTNLFRLKLS